MQAGGPKLARHDRSSCAGRDMRGYARNIAESGQGVVRRLAQAPLPP